MALGLANLLKMIPGVGTIAGIVIDAAVASGMTVALGIAYSLAIGHLANLSSQAGPLPT